jgi:hypothetical protein
MLTKRLSIIALCTDNCLLKTIKGRQLMMRDTTLYVIKLNIMMEKWHLKKD